MHEPGVLYFPAGRPTGWFPVNDGRGRTVARVSPAWGGGRFTVTGPGGEPMCTASSRRWRPPGTWQVAGPDGALLLTVGPTLHRDTATVRLQRGGHLTAHGGRWRFDLAIRDGRHRAARTVIPRVHDFAVRLPEPGVFGPPEAIALVRIWRMAGRFGGRR